MQEDWVERYTAIYRGYTGYTGDRHILAVFTLTLTPYSVLIEEDLDGILFFDVTHFTR
jgi:hypothetical protein